MTGDGTILIDERFNGPPASANGGYSCGMVAGALDAAAAEVSLRLPPPLGVPLEVHRAEDGVEVHGPDGVVATGRALDGIDAEPPSRPALADAAAAQERYPWFERHAFPTCFVCGPRRAGDGLELFAGPLDDGSGVYAAVWEPDPEWGADGAVRDEIVWAALDCPSAVPVMPADAAEPACVLARLAASLERPVAPGSPHVVVSWELGRDGRKRHSASAIIDPSGQVAARARALWIELRKPAATG